MNKAKQISTINRISATIMEKYLSDDGKIFQCINQNLEGVLEIPATGKWINLQKLDCKDNQLTTLIIPPELVNLLELKCPGNPLTTLIIPPELVNLQKLYCSHNQLTTFTIPSELVNLQKLYCWSNNLTTLTIPPQLINLRKLICNNNQLTTLIISPELVNLWKLHCNNNIIPVNNLREFRIWDKFVRIFSAYKIYYFLKNIYKYQARRLIPITFEIPYHPLCAKYNRQSDMWVD